MRASAIIAALVASSPLVQARACRPRHSSSTLLPTDTATTPTASPEETYIPPESTEVVDNGGDPVTSAPAEEATESPEEVATTTTAAEESVATDLDNSVESGSDASAWAGDLVDGLATYYGSTDMSGMHCSFSTLTLPAGMLGVAYSGSNWNNAANCGACMKVAGPNGNTTKVMVVDECPECPVEHLDLWETAFGYIAEKSAGEVSITYEYIECGITSPLKLLNKVGASEYWFAMQVNNANIPVESLEFSTDGGNSWTATTRADYNYFLYEDGTRASPVDVRVTSVKGTQITVKDVSVASNEETEAASNF